MRGGDHEPCPEADEGGPCWCGAEGVYLKWTPKGECTCHISGGPCWACENAVLICESCYCEIDEMDWAIIALGPMFGQ